MNIIALIKQFCQKYNSNVLFVDNLLEFNDAIVNENGTLKTSDNSQLVNHLAKIEYKQVLKVFLKEKSKENVVKLI